ncbi:MAG: hypothetical protein SGILL_008065, partial [Bacillariaceae sp.]
IQYFDDVLNVSSIDAIGFENTSETVVSDEGWYCELAEEDADITGSTFVKVTGIDENFFDEIIPGEATLIASGAMIEGDEMLIPDGAEVEIGEVPIVSTNSTDGRRRRLSTTGDKTFLVVRVDQTNGPNTEATENKIRQETYLGNSLKKQYKDCSHDQFNVIPYIGNGITNGVTSVTVTAGDTSKGSDIRNAAVAALKKKLGNIDPKNVVDHVMICLPPGTGNWIAYVYNNNWCLKLSVQVHEVGHNLGLPHSGEGSNNYDDKSGMMVRIARKTRAAIASKETMRLTALFCSYWIQGYSYGENDTPLMCFNPAKSWKLGWYKNQYDTFNGNSGPKTYTINGVVDYDEDDSSKEVVVEVLSGEKANFYVGYNRAVGFNAGTKEAANQVVIVQSESRYAPSKLFAKLDRNQKATLVQNYKGQGRDLIARFRSLSQGKDAIVDVFFSDCDPQNQQCGPTPNPTPNPTPSPTDAPQNGSCSGNRASLVVEVMTDEYGDLDNSWKVLRRNGNFQAGGVPSFPRRNDKFTNETCLQKNQMYDFILDDSYGDSLCCQYGQGYYKGFLNGKLIFSGGEGFKFKAKHSFM